MIMHQIHSIRRRVQTGFYWLGSGAMLVLLAFFGGVSADSSTVETYRLPLLSLGSLGIIFVIVGLFVLIMSARDADKGGYDVR